MTARTRQRLTGCAIQLALIGWLGVLTLGGAAVFPLLSRDARTFLVPAVLMAWIGTAIPVGFVVALVVIVRRNLALDRVFVAWGPGNALAPVARGWATRIDGRELNAWFSKGPQLELYLTCAARSEGGIGPKNALTTFASRVSGREAIELGDGLVAHGRDTAWMRALTSDPGARAALTELLSDEGILRAVTVQPEAVKLTLRRFDLDDLTSERAEAWTRNLGIVARTIDVLPPPSEPLEPGGLAARLRTNRGSLGGMLLFVVVFTILLVGCSGLLSAAIVLSSGF